MAQTSAQRTLRQFGEQVVQVRIRLDVTGAARKHQTCKEPCLVTMALTMSWQGFPSVFAIWQQLVVIGQAG